MSCLFIWYANCTWQSWNMVWRTLSFYCSKKCGTCPDQHKPWLMANGCDILIFNYLRLLEKLFKHIVLQSPAFNSDVIFKQSFTLFSNLIFANGDKNESNWWWWWWNKSNSNWNLSKKVSKQICSHLAFLWLDFMMGS